jgi:hypothetical protein
MRWHWILFFILNLSILHAQGRYQLAFQPEVNFQKKLPKGWKINLNIQSRQMLAEGLWQAPEAFRYNYVQTDVSYMAARKTNLGHSLAGGYMSRFQGNSYFHRLIQQYTVAQQLSGLRLAHRFSADQTFGEGEALNLRLRYRIALELPFSGQEVNPGELYSKLSNEYLMGFEAGETIPEIRLIPFVGYVFNDNNKLEWGLDYRLRDFELSRFFVSVKWFVAL